MKLHHELLLDGVDSYVFWGRGRNAENDREMKFATDFQVKLDGVQTRLFGRAGFYSKAATRKLLTRLNEFHLGKSDIIHLHNLHGYYINVEMLFNWLFSQTCQVKWTLHDCWAFTGHCAHFTYAQCEQWKEHCADKGGCPQIDAYPKTISKASVKWNFECKKSVFTLIPANRMTLFVPSRWLARLIADSFLAKYPVEVRCNAIDRTVFKPTPSDFRERHGLQGLSVILGVANPWTERKGLDDYIRLAHDADERFAIVLVGLSKKQIVDFPKDCRCKLVLLQKTESRRSLAEIYSAADCLFNPSKEENYPTVNLEAEACGTPVYTYDVGGCSETITLENSRLVDYSTLLDILNLDGAS